LVACASLFCPAEEYIFLNTIQAPAPLSGDFIMCLRLSSCDKCFSFDDFQPNIIFCKKWPKGEVKYAKVEIELRIQFVPYLPKGNRLSEYGLASYSAHLLVHIAQLLDLTQTDLQNGGTLVSILFYHSYSKRSLL